MKKIILGMVATAAIVVAALIMIPSEKAQHTEIYHARLADPKMYQDGVFHDSFQVRAGTYEFRFVPNGDSPQVLSITLSGPSFSFSEDFELEGTAHDTGISEYYTWKYLGNDTIEIAEEQELDITINPNGNTMGPVSVYLVE